MLSSIFKQLLIKFRKPETEILRFAVDEPGEYYGACREAAA
jgi:hypothetical protein